MNNDSALRSAWQYFSCHPHFLLYNVRNLKIMHKLFTSKYIDMKKIILLMTVGILTFLVTGCSWFDSNPVEPEIIGTGYIKLDRSGNFVEIDSVRYYPQKILTGEHHPRTLGEATMQPVDGMLVTVYKCRNGNNLNFIAGNKDEEAIEALYHRNYTVMFYAMLLFVLCICVFGMRFGKRKHP